MEWSESISEAINYIESHITEELTIADIAKQAIISPYYFQKGFSMLCGFTVGEYIKRRRLTLAGSEIVSTDRKIIDIALEYGYDSPDSFTKAFLRFHGATPTAIRKGEAMIKSFAPLKIKLILTGGYTMDYKIVKKAPFTVVGVSRVFKYETADTEIPKFWVDFNQLGKHTLIDSMYGISMHRTPTRLKRASLSVVINAARLPWMRSSCSQRSYTSRPPGAAKKAMSSPIRYGNPSGPVKSRQRKPTASATNWPPDF